MHTHRSKTRKRLQLNLHILCIWQPPTTTAILSVCKRTTTTSYIVSIKFPNQPSAAVFLSCIFIQCIVQPTIQPNASYIFICNYTNWYFVLLSSPSLSLSFSLILYYPSLFLVPHSLTFLFEYSSILWSIWGPRLPHRPEGHMLPYLFMIC